MNCRLTRWSSPERLDHLRDDSSRSGRSISSNYIASPARIASRVLALITSVRPSRQMPSTVCSWPVDQLHHEQWPGTARRRVEDVDRLVHRQRQQRAGPAPRAASGGGRRSPRARGSRASPCPAAASCTRRSRDSRARGRGGVEGRPASRGPMRARVAEPPLARPARSSPPCRRRRTIASGEAYQHRHRRRASTAGARTGHDLADDCGNTTSTPSRWASSASAGANSSLDAGRHHVEVRRTGNGPPLRVACRCRSASARARRSRAARASAAPLPARPRVSRTRRGLTRPTVRPRSTRRTAGRSRCRACGRGCGCTPRSRSCGAAATGSTPARRTFASRWRSSSDDVRLLLEAKAVPGDLVAQDRRALERPQALARRSCGDPGGCRRATASAPSRAGARAASRSGSRGSPGAPRGRCAPRNRAP